MKRNTMLLVAAGVGVAALALSGKLGGLGGGFLGEGAAGTNETKKETTITEEGGVQGEGFNLPADTFGGFPQDTYNVTNLFAPPPAVNVAKGCGSADLALSNRIVSVGEPYRLTLEGTDYKNYNAGSDVGLAAFEAKYGGGAGSNALAGTAPHGAVSTGINIGLGTAFGGLIGGILAGARSQGYVDPKASEVTKSLYMGTPALSSGMIAKKDAITVGATGAYNFASQDVANFAAGTTKVNAPLSGTGIVVPVGTSGGTGILTTIANTKSGGGYAVVSGGQIQASGSSGAPAGAVAAVAGANMSSAAAFSASIAASKKSGAYYR